MPCLLVSVVKGVEGGVVEVWLHGVESVVSGVREGVVN